MYKRIDTVGEIHASNSTVKIYVSGTYKYTYSDYYNVPIGDTGVWQLISTSRGELLSDSAGISNASEESYSGRGEIYLKAGETIYINLNRFMYGDHIVTISLSLK